jgi:hypothetical protein
MEPVQRKLTRTVSHVVGSASMVTSNLHHVNRCAEQGAAWPHLAGSRIQQHDGAIAGAGGQAGAEKESVPCHRRAAGRHSQQRARHCWILSAGAPLQSFMYDTCSTRTILCTQPMVQVDLGSQPNPTMPCSPCACHLTVCAALACAEREAYTSWSRSRFAGHLQTHLSDRACIWQTGLAA